MPALSPNSNRTIRRTPEVQHTPLVYAPPKVSAPAFQKAIPKAPFQGVQQHLQRNVERTQAALPKQPTPNIPYLPHPSHAQATAALTIAAEHAKRIGPKAFKELAQDPRQRTYLATVKHYMHAAEGQYAAGQVGREAAALSSPARLTEAARPLVEQKQRKAAEGASPLNLGFVNLTPIATALATAHVLPSGSGVLGTLGRIGNEAIDMPAQTFLSSAIAGSAASEAVKGKPQRGEQLLGQVASQIEHPIRSAEQAPLSTALLFAGGENALARLAGKAGRAGMLGEKAAQAFSTERPALKLYNPALPEKTPVEPQVRTSPTGPVRAAQRPAPERPVGEGLEKLQTYNKDPLRKAAQVAYEKALPKLPGDFKQSDPFQAEGWRLKRNLVGGTVHPGRVDYMHTAGQRTRQLIVKGTNTKVEAARPTVGEHLVPLIVQRVVRSPDTMIVDLEKERAKLLAAQDAGLEPAHLAANKNNLTFIEGLLHDRALHENPKAAFDAAARIEQIQHPLEAALVHGGKITPDQLRSALFPYAQAHMGAVHDGTALRGPDGQVLSNGEILAHMKQAGLRPPTFLSHKPGVAGRSLFFKSTVRFPAIERHARTGSAFQKGIADHSWQGLAGTVARQASDAAQLEVKARELSKLAMVPREGGFASREAAQHYAENNFHHTPGGETVEGGLGGVKPIHLGADQILERGNVTPGDVQATLKQFGKAEHTPPFAKQNGKYGLIPDEVAARIQAHEDAVGAKGELKRQLQAYSQAFRKAKLNTSTRHIAGVIQEQGIRLGFETAGPWAAKAGKKYREGLEHLAETSKGSIADDHGPLGARFRELESVLASRGGQVASYQANQIRRTADQFSNDTLGGKLIHAGSNALHTPPGRAALRSWHEWQKVAEGGLIHVEQFTHNAMLGKALRDSGFIDSYHQTLKMQDQAVHDLIRGQLTPNKADALARRVDEMMGNWNHLTPTVRGAVSTVTPFGLWWLNSMRWLYRLPVTHPIKTAIVAALYNATRTERNTKGQGFDAAHPVPAFLQGTIDTHLPVVGKVSVAPSYYSPGGTLGAETFNTAAEQFLPQGSSIYAAARGQNPLTGAKLTDSHGKELGPLAIGGNILAETASGPTPFATQAQTLLQKGGKPYGTANLFTDALSRIGGPRQVKPGTERPLPEVLTKLLSPVRFNFPGKGKGAGGKATVTGGSVSPAEAAAIRRAEQRYQTAGGSAAEEARIKRAEEQFDRTGR